MRYARVSFGFITCLLLLGFAAQPAAVSAQQPGQEKRIALVIGNGAYAKGPLATAANDAGLIAQTLQAAGFDVIGARDLDGDTLRKSFRDFMQKASSSDNNTVAMIYLAGYAVQLAGENYFIPVDSTINRDTDIPTEGLRISDYIRQLAALPLKAGVVVLDAARQQPFVEGPSIAGGLALVEPEANMLIAFNAAPGTVAPSENGPYGTYAQSLAEMIRTGGLSLPDVFDRLRLRVNEATKGAQVPWDAQKIAAQFTFFDRSPDAPAAQAQPAAIRDRPIRELSVQDAYAAAIERDTLQAYEDFLATYDSDPLAKRVRAIVAARREAITWRRTYRTDTPDAYWSYLKRYPHGPHAEDARRRLAVLTAPLEPPPTFAMIDYDVPPPPPDEIVYVDRPVLMFADPDFGFLPPPPPPVYFLPPPPPDFVVLSPPIAPVGLFILPQPLFVPIPVYVRPPTFVAPPPNNIIFNNIHNTTVINTVINQPPAPAANGPRGAAAPAQPIAPATAATLPPAVAQRAALIQQGKAPVPPSAATSAAISSGARLGTPTPGQALGTPGGPAQPQAAPSQAAPAPGTSRANALPVPGNHGGPPAPSASTSPVNPHAALTPPAAPSPQGQGQAPRPGQAPAQLDLHPDHRGQPGAAPSQQVNRAPAGAPAAPAVRPVPGPQHPIAPTATAPARPELRSRTAPPVMARPAPPMVARPAPPPAAARPSPPPAMAARPVAPMVHAAPPPPRPAAPPPMARPSPPPAAAMARPMAPPPAMARPAAPPPRPAAPPPAKRCPPNVPHC